MECLLLAEFTDRAILAQPGRRECIRDGESASVGWAKRSVPDMPATSRLKPLLQYAFLQ
jgi:hypothetical protein